MRVFGLTTLVTRLDLSDAQIEAPSPSYKG